MGGGTSPCGFGVWGWYTHMLSNKRRLPQPLDNKGLTEKPTLRNR